MRITVTALAFFSCFWIAYGESMSFEGMALEPGISINGATVPIGGNGIKDSPVVMKVGEITLQPSKFGFVSIAVVPQVIFRNLVLIVNKTTPQKDSWAISLLEFMKKERLVDQAVIQGFELQNNTTDELPVVKSRAGKFFPSRGQITLEGVVIRDENGDQSIQTAIIWLEGPTAGYLVWQGDQGPRFLKLMGSVF